MIIPLISNTWIGSVARTGTCWISSRESRPKQAPAMVPMILLIPDERLSELEFCIQIMAAMAAYTGTPWGRSSVRMSVKKTATADLMILMPMGGKENFVIYYLIIKYC
jgi:hypothetical protein